METGAGAILLVIGVVALFAAIVGGGVKIKEIEVGSLPSKWRQGFLAIFGIVVGVTGLVMVSGILDSGNATEPAQNVENADQGAYATPTEATTDTNAGDQNETDANGTDANGTETAAENSPSEDPN
jgi:hypothetical protein